MITNELYLIDWVRRKAANLPSAGLRMGIGDDAAILSPPPPRQEILLTTDLVVEGVHFERGRHPAGALGHKVLARGLSDIAAMGGRPRYALLSVCLPGWSGAGWQKQLYLGLFRLARRFGVALIGGDVAAGERFAADIVVVGTAPRGQALRRSGARPGDVLYVSGALGGSALGLERLRRGRGPRDPAVRRHLYPTPRLDLGRRLVRLGATAAMDLSDGLSIDLYRLANASAAGAEVRASAVPRYPGASLEQALHGGEDYELLFTLPPSRPAPPGAYAIGLMTSHRGRLLLTDDRGRKSALPVKGYTHNV